MRSAERQGLAAGNRGIPADHRRMAEESAKRPRGGARPFRSLGNKSKRKPHRSPGVAVWRRQEAHDASLAAVVLCRFGSVLCGVTDILRGIAAPLRRVGDRSCSAFSFSRSWKARKAATANARITMSVMPPPRRGSGRRRLSCGRPVAFAGRMNFIRHAVLRPDYRQWTLKADGGSDLELTLISARRHLGGLWVAAAGPHCGDEGFRNGTGRRTLESEVHTTGPISGRDCRRSGRGARDAGGRWAFDLRCPSRHREHVDIYDGRIDFTNLNKLCPRHRPRGLKDRRC